MPAILRKFDIVGTVLATGSIFCLLLATQWGGQTMPSSSATVVGLFVGSGVLCILFFIVEYRLGPDAILPFHILLQRSVMSGAWYLFFFAMPTYVVRASNDMLQSDRQLTLPVRILHSHLLPDRQRSRTSDEWRQLPSTGIAANWPYSIIRMAGVSIWILRRVTPASRGLSY